MVLETFYPRGAEGQGRNPGQEKKFVEPLAEQETFAVDLKQESALSETVEQFDARELMKKINDLENGLHAILIRNYLELGEQENARRLGFIIEVEK